MARKPYARFKVNSRYLVRLLEDYASLTDFGEASDSSIARKPHPGAGSLAGPHCELVSFCPVGQCDPFGTGLGLNRLRSRLHAEPK